MLTTSTPVRFDGRDVSDEAPPDAVTAYGLITCPYCGTTRDERYPYCCEFAAQLLAPALVAAR
ncbi:MAG TPA: hypothetical protein VII06_13015 [Chloroflexota bacterium]|jgi:hypothetical protein